ncbi:MAG: succinate dehydrogenase, hydrophobic membrane anchor protein [Aestuariivirgaceae bacterium]
MGFRTPLARVRGLGSAKSGTEHWWHERVSAVASIPTTLFLIWLGIAVAGHDHAAIVAMLGHPLVATGLALSLITILWHMRLGMQVIIEDYVHSGAKFWLLIANNFLVVLMAAGGLQAIVRLSAGAP